MFIFIGSSHIHVTVCKVGEKKREQGQRWNEHSLFLNAASF